MKFTVKYMQKYLAFGERGLPTPHAPEVHLRLWLRTPTIALRQYSSVV